MPAGESGTALQRGRSLRVWLALATVLAAGVVLRLIWLNDIEYKVDEEWTWWHARAALRSEPWSWVGMPTSAGPENPGMSLWVFIPLRWFGDRPVDMARGVAGLSIVAILLTVVFAWRSVPKGEREIWLWAAALWAVHPLSVVHHRKIWPPCTFPLLEVLFVVCWWHRDRALFAFFWGALGSVLAQINPSAGFFAMGFALWAWCSTRFAARHRETEDGLPGPSNRNGDGLGRPSSFVAWKSWLAGSVLASLPLIPWFIHISTLSTQPHVTTLKWTRILEGKFFFRWLIEPFGIGLDHALGDDNLDFLSQPVVAGVPTYLVGALHMLGLSIALAIGWRCLREWRERKPTGPRDWRSLLFPCDSPTALVCNAGFWGYGILLTLTCLPLHRQYMIIVYSIELLWVAQAALKLGGGCSQSLHTGRRLLGGLVVVQLLISASFLSYVHVKQVIHGDYGVALCAQRRASDGAATTR